MSGNEYIKYLTGRFISYLDSSNEERNNRKMKKKKTQDVISNRWLGMLPLAIKVFWKKAN
ncbi:YqzE family protein [Virgibacillus flavescens]|uniref:YqzE family protein n=1 Tax=Virgibacillus flavescens TaxID=1611422 RepID=UPI003D348612